MFATPRLRTWSVLLFLIAPALVPLVLFFAPTSPVLAAETHPAPPVAPPLHKPNSIFVTNNNDNGAGSLRNAINTAGGFDNIFFASNVSGTITLTTGELVITQPVSIIGPGEAVLAISGNNASRVIEIGGDNSVDISGLTIREGRLYSNTIGAGILVSDSVYFGGYLNLTNVSIISNTIADSACDYCDGAGIASGFFGQVHLTNVTLKNNLVSSTTDCNYCGGAAISDGDGPAFFNLTNVTISDNVVKANGTCNYCAGGGILNIDSLFTILNSRINDNQILGGSCSECTGGGVSNVLEGVVNLTNATVSGNVISDTTFLKPSRLKFQPRTLNGRFSRQPQKRQPNAPTNGYPLGGGIFNFGIANLNDVTLSGNTAQFYGAGGAIHNEGQMNVTNATLSGNLAGGGGGLSNGIFDSTSAITLTHVTVNANLFEAASIYVFTGTILLQNSIVSNDISASNCYTGTGTISFNGNNLQSFDNSCGGFTVADPKLAPLGNYGGATKTQPPLVGSPALDAASNAFCPGLDQRGAPRPQGPACDIGAVEFGTGLRFLFLPYVSKSPIFFP